MRYFYANPDHDGDETIFQVDSEQRIIAWKILTHAVRGTIENPHWEEANRSWDEFHKLFEWEKISEEELFAYEI